MYCTIYDTLTCLHAKIQNHKQRLQPKKRKKKKEEERIRKIKKNYLFSDSYVSLVKRRINRTNLGIGCFDFSVVGDINPFGRFQLAMADLRPVSYYHLTI